MNILYIFVYTDRCEFILIQYNKQTKGKITTTLRIPGLCRGMISFACTQRSNTVHLVRTSPHNTTSQVLIHFGTAQACMIPLLLFLTQMFIQCGTGESDWHAGLAMLAETNLQSMAVTKQLPPDVKPFITECINHFSVIPCERFYRCAAKTSQLMQSTLCS